MSKPTPTRYVVRPAVTQTRRRHPGWLGLGWALSLAVAVGVTYGLTHSSVAHGNLDMSGSSAAPRLAARNAALEQQLADLRQERAVDKVSMRKLQHDLADRDQQISGLRADLAFYSHLVGGAGQGVLQVQGVQLEPVPHSPHAWNLTLTLTRNARDNGDSRGTARIALEGVRRHALKRLPWPQLAGDQPKDGMAFDFKYFQQLHATVLLPAGFMPNKLHVTVTPHHGDTITRDVTWNDALKKAGQTHVQP